MMDDDVSAIAKQEEAAIERKKEEKKKKKRRKDKEDEVSPAEEEGTDSKKRSKREPKPVSDKDYVRSDKLDITGMDQGSEGLVLRDITDAQKPVKKQTLEEFQAYHQQQNFPPRKASGKENLDIKNSLPDSLEKNNEVSHVEENSSTSTLEKSATVNDGLLESDGTKSSEEIVQEANIAPTPGAGNKSSESVLESPTPGHTGHPLLTSTPNNSASAGMTKGVDESFKSEIERLRYKIKIYKDKEDHYVKEIQDLKTQIDEVQEKYKKKKKEVKELKSKNGVLEEQLKEQGKQLKTKKIVKLIKSGEQFTKFNEDLQDDTSNVKESLLHLLIETGGIQQCLFNLFEGKFGYLLDDKIFLKSHAAKLMRNQFKEENEDEPGNKEFSLDLAWAAYKKSIRESVLSSLRHTKKNGLSMQCIHKTVASPTKENKRGRKKKDSNEDSLISSKADECLTCPGCKKCKDRDKCKRCTTLQEWYRDHLKAMEI